MAAEQIINSGVMIDGETMSADISFANRTCKLLDIQGYNMVGLQVYTESAAQDHAGTIYFRLTNDEDRTPVAMSSPTITVAAGALNDDWVDLVDINAKYLEVFYDRTSGGAVDTLTVTAHVKRNSSRG
jgi:hypothetical protein